MALDYERFTFTASIVNAISNRAVRNFAIGSLVWGRVRKINDWGLFLAIDDTFESALLHITNVSWKRVDSIDEHFQEGDRVRAVIVGMDAGYKRLSVSTRDLEAQEGDMLTDKPRVYAEAETNVQTFLAHVREWEAEEAAAAAAEAGM